MKTRKSMEFSRAKKVAEIAKNHAEKTEALGQLHSNVLEALLEANLPDLLKPENPSNFREFIHVCGILAEGCMSTGWCNFVWGMHNYLVALYPKATQAQVWSHETSANRLVSASLAPTGEAIRENNSGLIVSGRWTYASGCDHADWLLLGIRKLGDEPYLGLFHRTEVNIDDTWQVMGLRGTGSKDIVVDNIQIPQNRLLPFSVALAPYHALLVLVIVGPVIGGAQAAANHFREILKTSSKQTRKPNPKSVPDLLRLAESTAEIDTARTIILSAADLLEKDPRPDRYNTAKIIRDTAFAAKLSNRATNRIFEASGGSALKDSHPMQRIYRDVIAGCAHARLRWDEQAISFATVALSDD